MSTPLLGIDLGGTKIEGAVIRLDRAGDVDVLVRERTPTLREEGYDAVVDRVARLASSVARDAGLAIDSVPIGVGMPGGVERRAGLVKNSNTTCLNGRPFRADLERALGRSIVFDNDANCFALAETLAGAARGHADGVVFGVILGTGVGGGLVVRGRTWPGLHGIAGEWGHHAVFAGDPSAVECYCGGRGCLETYASGPAVERRYEALSGSRLSLSRIAARALEDPHARASIDGLLDAFGRGIANVIDLIDPSAVVLGGGVSNLDVLYVEGRSRVEALVFNDELLTPILRHELGDSAGVIGAAFLARSA